MPSERLRWRDVRATTQFRLVMLLGVLFLAGLWATLGLDYWLTARELTARSDRIIAARAADLLAVPPAALPARIQAEITNSAAGISYFALQGSDGTLVTGNVRLSTAAQPGAPFTVDARPGGHGPLRVLAVRDAAGETIVLGRDVSPIRDLRRRLLLILVASGVIGTAGMLGAAVAFSRGPLRRVRDLERVARAIGAGDLARRMPIAGRHDELDRLAATVNLMVDEVGHVVAQVKTATDAVAHDLRTPLGRVRASLRRLHEDGLPSAAAAQVDAAIVDLDAVLDRFAALLRLAELEAGERRARLRPIAIAPLLVEMSDLYEPLAEERGLTLDSSSDDATASVVGDPELLAEAVGNLLDNAIKFADSRVFVQLLEDAGEPVVEVIDDGPGVPADEREAVLRRFHRAKGAGGVEGTGLGLAIVSAIVRLHGFALELDDAAPGLIARVRFSARAKRKL